MKAIVNNMKTGLNNTCKAMLANKRATQTLLFAGLSVLAFAAGAQDITMPTVDIDGIDADSSGDTILITIIKFVARIAVWAMMIVGGFIGMKRILGSWNEQKQNDQGRWGAVIGDSIGSIILILFVIALGTWILTFLA